jgi:hypothetical protein
LVGTSGWVGTGAKEGDLHGQIASLSKLSSREYH